MKVLIVDDDSKRSAGLLLHLVRSEVLSADSVDVVVDVRSARELLKAKYYDVLILDVVLPRREGEGKAAPDHGIGLLVEVTRSKFLKKPEKIIGITAHVESIGRFRDDFERSCSVVVSTDGSSSAWKENIADSLRYTFGSKVARECAVKKTVVLTVHGIRTYGEWQQRLRGEVERASDEVEFFTYKYGYFSSLALAVRSLRDREVEKLCSHVRAVAGAFAGCRIVVFAHSFGTYLVANAMKRLITEGIEFDIVLVLCGSVLPEEFDWSFIAGSRVRVINECGCSDFVLYLSKAIVPGLGMAGKVGFHGFNHSGFVNRFYLGGHSLYFEGESFFRKRWVPLMAEMSEVEVLDERKGASIVWASLDSTVALLGAIKGIAIPITLLMGTILVAVLAI